MKGALISRALIEMWKDHSVDTFISLVGPQLGQFGHPLLFLNLTRDILHLFLYNGLSQKAFSIANMWNDPANRESYLQKNLFLPIINNEVNHTFSEDFKRNFLRTKKVVLIASSADEIITPWQSSVFGFFDANKSTIIPMHEQQVYVQDLFGLKTLDEENRLEVITATNVTHAGW